MREAMRVLEHAGVVVVRTGSGTFITETGASKVAVVRARTTVQGDPSPLDVLTARSALEPVCAAEAARVWQGEDIDLIRQALAIQHDSLNDSDARMEADYSFHVSIARTTHNLILLDLVEQLTKLMRQAAHQEFQRRVHDRPESHERYLEHHHQIVEAIAAHASDDAARAMSDHLAAVTADLDREAE